MQHNPFARGLVQRADPIPISSHPAASAIDMVDDEALGTF